jgi:hypothetical protein
MTSTKRKIDGKIYVLLNTYSTKKEAREDAKNLRSKGTLARVLEMGGKSGLYEIWAH